MEKLKKEKHLTFQICYGREGKSMNKREDTLWNGGEWLVAQQETSEYWKVHWQFTALTSLNQNAGHWPPL